MITNPADPQVKAIARLSQRSRRDEAGVFIVEGPQAVRELLTFAPSSVVDVFYTAAFAEKHRAIIQLAERSPAVMDEVSDKVLEVMADTVNPQGVIAVAQVLSHSLSSIDEVRLVAVCDEIRDPGNAGAVIRAADAAGADAVILTGASVDLHNPKLVRSSTGSIFHLPIIEHDDLADVTQVGAQPEPRHSHVVRAACWGARPRPGYMQACNCKVPVQTKPATGPVAQARKTGPTQTVHYHTGPILIRKHPPNYHIAGCRQVLPFANTPRRGSTVLGLAHARCAPPHAHARRAQASRTWSRRSSSRS